MTTADLKSLVNLPALVGQYVRLKKGRGLCPFHSEKTPSFKVSGTYWHCFGCGAGGSAIDFLVKIEGISVRDAIKRLEEEAGVKPGKKQERLDPQEQARADFWWSRHRAAVQEMGALYLDVTRWTWDSEADWTPMVRAHTAHEVCERLLAWMDLQGDMKIYRRFVNLQDTREWREAREMEKVLNAVGRRTAWPFLVEPAGSGDYRAVAERVNRMRRIQEAVDGS